MIWSPAPGPLWNHWTWSCQHVFNPKLWHTNTYSDFITRVDRDGLGRLDVGYVALHRLGGDIGDGRVVGRSVNVSTLRVAVAKVFVVDGNTPDGAVGAGSTGESESRDERLHFE